MWAWFEQHPRVADLAIGGVALVLFGLADLLRDGARGALITVLFAVSVVFWRRLPGLGLAIAWVGALVQVLTFGGLLVGDLLILVAVFATGLARSRAVRVAGVVSGIVGGAIAGARLVLFAPASSDAEFLVTGLSARGVPFAIVSGVVAAALILFWALGVLVRNRQAAARQRLERDRDRILAEAALIQEKERALLSREMHDLIGHALAVVIAQSDGARYAKANDPHAESTALETINRTARAAIDDVHELLSVLREPSDARRAAVTSADLEQLLASVGDAGLAVSLAVTGEPVALSGAHELAMYRVLQESLTNAIKHGGPGARAEVRIAWGADDVRFGVVTSEPARRAALLPAAPAAGASNTSARRSAATAPSAGQGLIGMSERMRLLDGSVATGPRTGADPGFTVSARLPYRAPDGFR